MYKKINNILRELSKSDIKELIGTKCSLSRITDISSDTIGIFVGRTDKNYLVKFLNSNAPTIQLSKFLINDISIVKNNQELLNLLEKITNNSNFKPANNNISDDELNNNIKTQKAFIENIFSLSELENDFIEKTILEKLELPIFKQYEAHLGNILHFANLSKINAKIIDKWEHKQNDIQLFISNHNLKNDDDYFNCRYLKKGLKGCRNIGFYFKKSKKKTTKVLIVTEGAKDGFNSFICSNYDVFAYDSKGSIPAELIELINNNIYSKVVILNDKDDIDIYTTFSEKVKNTDKLNYLDWVSLVENFPVLQDVKNADITDILKELFKTNTISVIKQRLFNKIFKEHSISFNIKDIKKRVVAIQSSYKYLLNINDIDKIKELLINVYFLVKQLRDSKNEALTNLYIDMIEFLLKDKTIFTNSTTITINNYIEEAKNNVIKFIDANQKMLISSVAGSGKSTFFKNLAGAGTKILFIVPLKVLMSEFESEKINVIDDTNKDIIEGLIRDSAYAKNSMVMTTDRFILNQIAIKEVIDSNYFDMIIFDEQHLIETAMNFRYSLPATKKILSLITNTKIVYLSATPTKIDCALLKADSLKKTNIEYQIVDDNIITDLNEKLSIMNANDSLLIYVIQLKQLKTLIIIFE